MEISKEIFIFLSMVVATAAIFLGASIIIAATLSYFQKKRTAKFKFYKKIICYNHAYCGISCPLNYYCHRLCSDEIKPRHIREIEKELPKELRGFSRNAISCVIRGLCYERQNTDNRVLATKFGVKEIIKQYKPVVE